MTRPGVRIPYSPLLLHNPLWSFKIICEGKLRYEREVSSALSPSQAIHSVGGIRAGYGDSKGSALRPVVGSLATEASMAGRTRDRDHCDGFRGRLGLSLHDYANFNTRSLCPAVDGAVATSLLSSRKSQVSGSANLDWFKESDDGARVGDRRTDGVVLPVSLFRKLWCDCPRQ